jgi:hypothetical protein
MSTKIVRNAEFMLRLAKQASVTRAVQNKLESAAHLKAFETAREKDLNELFEQIASYARHGAVWMFFHENQLLKDIKIQRYLSKKGFTINSNSIQWSSPQTPKDDELR